MTKSQTNIPLHSEEAENYILGYMVNYYDHIEGGFEDIFLEDFYHLENKEIFSAIKEINKQEIKVTVDNIGRYLDTSKKNKIAGDFDYKSRINYVSLISVGIDVDHYFRVLKEHTAKRKLSDFLQESYADIQRGTNLDEIINRHKKIVASVENGLIRDERFQIRSISELGENWLYEEPPKKKMLLTYIDESQKIQGFIPAGVVSMLVGMGGIGKSHWVSQLTASIVTGTQFLDQFNPTTDCKGGNVFLGMAENDLEDIRRILHKSTKNIRTKPEPNLTPEEIKDALEHKIFPYSFHGQQCQFLKDGEPSPYFYELKRNLVKHSPIGGWTLIILDPISRFLGAEAETDNAAATAFIALMEQLTMELPGKPTILFCHHMSKSAISGNASSQGASRGSSALTDGTRLQINLRKLTDDEFNKLSDEEKTMELSIMTMSKSNFTRILKDTFLEKEGDGYISKHSKPSSLTNKNEEHCNYDENGDKIICSLSSN